MRQVERKFLVSEGKSRGIIRVVNLENGKEAFLKSEDMKRDIVSIRFRLDMEEFPLEELQREYSETGLELFSIEPHLILGEGEDADAALLQAREKAEREGITLYRA